jgi:hypothetical protein
MRPNVLIDLLFTILPNLTELYLGGSIPGNFPFFRPILTGKDIMGGWDFIKDCNFALEYFSYQLKGLELPADSYLCLMIKENGIRSIPKYFPELRKLIMPGKLIISRTDLEDIVPSKLESPVITNCEDSKDINDWISDVLHKQAEYFPSLRSANVYHNWSGYAASLQLRIRLKEVDTACKRTTFRCQLSLRVEFSCRL